jgi:hypothetical protein
MRELKFEACWTIGGGVVDDGVARGGLFEEIKKQNPKNAE